MLKELSIRNFAIIDDLHIQFSEGFTVLSGETGAGKSIILNAVNLLLGSRASGELVRSGAKAAELEARFQIALTSRTAAIMSDQGYDPEEGLLIRRIISRSDGNRVYLNGRLATIQLLTAITESLASISGQHAHQNLLKEEQHLLILDQFGGLLPQRQQLQETYRNILPLIEKLDELNRIRARQEEQTELLKFQRDEITNAALTPGEDSELAQQRLRLKNAEMLYQTVAGGIEMLYSGGGSVSERLLELRKNLEKAGQIDTQLKAQADRLTEVSFQIEDLVANLRSYLKLIEVDEQQLEAVEARLDTLNKLKRKYGGTLDGIFLKLAAIEADLSNVENVHAKIAEVENTLVRLHNQLVQQAEDLSRQRRQVAKSLAQKVIRELHSLKMAHTRFEVLLQPIPAAGKIDFHLKTGDDPITDSGMDRATFMIAPNVGEELKPLAAIASGGELSRVVLALKAILAETDAVETIVFDEVDAGIGGGTAEVVGRKLLELAKHHQVICITHLPQIAKFADHHFSISKQVEHGRTRTAIHRLIAAERHMEIARMLGGEEITPATLEHARELLEK